MHHLTSAELLDLIQGLPATAPARHLTTCAACRRRLAELRAAMEIGETEGEPQESPAAAWARVSKRLQGTIEGHREAVIGIVTGRGTPPRKSARSHLSRRLAVAGGIAGMLVVAAVAIFLVNAGWFKPPQTASDPTGAAVEPAANPAPPAGDAALSLLGDLVGERDSDAARAAGLLTHVRVDAEALSLLTVGERDELRRLLQEELARGGASPGRQRP